MLSRVSFNVEHDSYNFYEFVPRICYYSGLGPHKVVEKIPEFDWMRFTSWVDV